MEPKKKGEMTVKLDFYVPVKRYFKSEGKINTSQEKWGEGNGTPLQYSCLENPMDRGAWCAADHGVAGSRTRLSNFTFTFHFHALEKETATHSSVLAWRIPGMAEPGGLTSMGSHRVRHGWSDLAAAANLQERLSNALSFSVDLSVTHSFIHWFIHSSCICWFNT